MQQDSEKKSIICPQCGETNPTTNRYCAICGVNLNDSVANQKTQQLRQFMQLFGFTAQDLASNLSGQLTPAQKTSIRRYGTKLGLLGAFVFLVPSLCVSALVRNLWAFVILYLIVIAGVIFFSRRATNEVASRNDFTAYTGEVSVLRLKGRTYLTIPGHQISILDAAKSLFLPTKTYHVHFINLLGPLGGGMILSIAPSDIKVVLAGEEGKAVIQQTN